MSAVFQEFAPRTAFFPRLPPEELTEAQSRLLLWLNRQRQRARLAELEDWQLDDIGVSRSAAVTESRRWD